MMKWRWVVVGLVVLGGLLGWKGILSGEKLREVVKRVERALRPTGESFTGAGKSVLYAEDVAGKENLGRLKQGCPFKDCIPAIDSPKFEPAAVADSWLGSEDIVFGLDYNGEQRAYPQRILNWHEIVNDEVDGEPIAITFCPLCGSALAFDRRVEGRVLDFGVSGKLHNSDLVMYDRQTESLWQQITGEAIVGEFFGTRLTSIPMDTLRWREWRETHPGTEVLSRETGFLRDYAQHPYGTYEEDRAVYFPVENGVDETIHPKTVVYGVVVNDVAKAYTQKALERETLDDGVLTDLLGGERLRLSYSKGEVFVENLSIKTEVIPTRAFWFAWKAFYPKAELYE